jgi:hypothetical protein
LRLADHGKRRRLPGIIGPPPRREALATQTQTANPIAITGGTMEIETLNAINESMQASLMLMVEVILLIGILLTVVGLAIYLAGVAWLCFDESGSLSRQIDLPQQPETSASKARSARRLPLTSSLQ